MPRRIPLSLFTAGLAGLLATAAPAAGQDRQFTRTVVLQPTGMLRLQGGKGSIRPTSWDRSQVEIRARIELPDDEPADYAQQVVDATEIEVITTSVSVSIRSNYDRMPTRDRRHRRWGDRTVPAVHYEVRAPRRIDLQVNSDRGPTTIEGFEGTIDLVVDRGELDLRDAAGDVRLEIDRGERSRVSGVRGSLQIDADRTDLRIDALSLDRDSRIDADRGDIRRARRGRSAAHGADRHLSPRQLRQRFSDSMDVDASAPRGRAPERRRAGTAHRLRSREDRAAATVNAYLYP